MLLPKIKIKRNINAILFLRLVIVYHLPNENMKGHYKNILYKHIGKLFKHMYYNKICSFYVIIHVSKGMLFDSKLIHLYFKSQYR